ncbi:MAG TPA: hypothetical protein VMZ74_12145 [Ramlibacter sp.]|nr:hypothetical protein [Ramlibacter sp.]
MPRIAYLSWPPREISGGIKVAFQHVEMLVEAGFQAVIAAADAQRPDWFDTKAEVIGFDAIRKDDVLVFPENNPRFLAAFEGSGQPKVVFCQNAFFAHQGLGARPSYADYGVTHIMAPSMSVVQFCTQRFPGLKIGYTPFFIDHAKFRFTSAKTLQVAAVPRKRTIEFGAIVDLLRARHPQLGEVPWVVLHGVTEQQVAEGMMRSAVFLSLARLEAHSLTILEAMACGCICAGFTGVFGGNDSSTAKNGFWALEDDVLGAVDQLANAIWLVRAGGESYRLVQEEGRFTAKAYNREESARRLVNFWEDFGLSPRT